LFSKDYFLSGSLLLFGSFKDFSEREFPVTAETEGISWLFSVFLSEIRGESLGSSSSSGGEYAYWRAKSSF
jgi:hypothetical protein